MSEFAASDTMWEFMNDPAYVRLIAGNVGSGKSVCCSHEIIQLAAQQAPNKDGIRKSRTAVIRNTSDQLKTTTMKTLFDWFPPGEWGHYKATDRTYYLRFQLGDETWVESEIMFLPLDDPEDVRKVLSLELTFAWLNECREIRQEIIDGVLMRLRRYPSRKDGGPTRSCAIMDTNMPDQDTPMFQMMENPPANWAIFKQPPAILSFEEYYNREGVEPAPEDATEDARGVQWWINPRADNIEHLDPRYYPDIIPGKTETFIDVYLRCQYGRSLAGLPVYEKTFSREFHVAEKPFSAIRSEKYPLIVGLDLGRTPSCVIGQRNVLGQLVVLAELSSENMGIETFLSRMLLPRLAEPDLTGCSVMIAPDPAGWAKQQIGEHSPVDAILKVGLRVVRPLTNDPARRVEAVERLLLDHIGGKPALTINPTCTKLIQGFSWGYKYKLNRSGVQEDKPMKDNHSHLADAMQYLCLVADSGMQGGSSRSRDDALPVRVAPRQGWT